MEEIKVEFDKSAICHGCLSVNRELSTLGDYYEIFYYVLGEEILDLNDRPDVFLCWECLAVLRKLKMFQKQIRNARDMLADAYFHWKFQDDVYTLSTLGINKKDNYDLAIDEDAIEPILFVAEPEVKEESEDIIAKEENDPESEVDNIDIEDNLKIEPEVTKKVFSRSKGRQQSIKIYEKYAIITENKEIKLDDLSQHYVKVYLDEKEVEKLVDKRDRRDCSFPKMPYKCIECRLGYKRQTDLNRHNQFQHCSYEKPVRCLECNKKQPSLERMVKHWAHHSRMLRCLQCYNICRSLGELKKHMNRVHTSVYTCKQCNVQLNTLREFSVHYKHDHLRMYCDYCGKAFYKKSLLEGHIRRNHMPAYCVECNRSYQQYHVLENHIRTYHPHLMRGAVNSEASYCVECDKQYSSVYKYKRHILQSARHTPQKRIRVPCPDCGKVFTRTAYMNNHYRLVHVKDTKHRCELCHKYFATGYALRKHRQYVHEKKMMPKDKICDICGRGFSTNRILSNHRRTHTGERPFKCTHCGASFVQCTALQTHIKTQHKNVDNMPMQE
ncbi:oocyte zinc finger protein XlCOF6-like [Manduca sexta]|uniref:oocyte zinc finger protein XlCOF6-like n=1 Tax=Manduca sexta TaxID=7130 RepID=UPI00188E85CA|nr:oocyte zinc finger protein XlCOF6-like [Manduca sexta]